MSLLTPEQTVQLIKNGHRPDEDHTPVVHLQTIFRDQVIGAMLLTHIEPTHGKEAYGLIDFGNGVARMSMVFLEQMKSWYPRYDYKLEVQSEFEATHPISVYRKASEMMGGLITTSPAALKWAAVNLDITRSRDQLKKPSSNEGPVFLPFPRNLN